MLAVEKDDDGRILAALRLVDRRRVGEREFVEVGRAVLDGAPVEEDNERALRRLDGLDKPHVAVVDVLVRSCS